MFFFKLLKNIIGICLVVGLVFALINYGVPVKSQLLSFFHISEGKVKGTSTQKAEEISGKINNDIGNQVNSAQQQVLNVSVSDLVNGFSRLQKIPRDLHVATEYGQEQVANVLQSIHHGRIKDARPQADHPNQH